MKYHFDELINRKNTGCVKWDKAFPAFDKDILPLWVADMDFPCAEAIQQALKEKVDEQIYGYNTGFTPAYRQAVCGWFSKRFDWEIDPDTIFYAGGVVPAIAYLLEIMSEEGDGVIISTPVYYPFRKKIEATKRVVVENPLINEHGMYRIDFDDLEAKMARNDVKGMILCSPHNPVGRIWTKEELLKIVTLAKKYDKWIISDEIHCDLVQKDYEHQPLLKLAPEAKDRIVVCTAPSKSFNLAGLQNSNIIICNEKWQKKWTSYVMERLSLNGPNSFAIAATIAAYTKEDSEQWLADVNAYVDENDAFARACIQQYLPEAIISPRQGTYLLWVDVRAYCEDEKQLEETMLKEGLILDEGYLFGEAGKGFERINLACPRSIVETCVKRLCDALHK